SCGQDGHQRTIGRGGNYCARRHYLRGGKKIERSSLWWEERRRYSRRGTNSFRHFPCGTRWVLARLHENLRVLIAPKKSQGDVRGSARSADICTRHGARTSFL